MVGDEVNEVRGSDDGGRAPRSARRRRARTIGLVGGTVLVMAAMSACNPETYQYEHKVSGNFCATTHWGSRKWVYDGPIGTKISMRTEPEQAWTVVGWTTAEHVVHTFDSWSSQGGHCPSDAVLESRTTVFQAVDPAGNTVGNFDGTTYTYTCTLFDPCAAVPDQGLGIA